MPLKLTLFTVYFVIVVGSAFPAITWGGYQYGNPTAAEQAHLEIINRARLNPKAEADRLLGGNINEGITNPANQISLTPKQPLTFNAQLYQAAQLHSQDMINKDYFDHYSLDGRSPWERITAAGYTGYLTLAENIAVSLATYPLGEVPTLLKMHDDFVIDAYVQGRGHRVNIFNDALKEIGVGSATGAMQYGGYSYSFAWTLTCDFGTKQDIYSFVLGVVYDDKNKDGKYTAGEGLGGVQIVAQRVLDSQVVSTLTASAGGYGIPLTSSQYKVTATLADGRKLTKSISLVGKNIKVDFKASEFSNTTGQPVPAVTVPTDNFLPAIYYLLQAD